MTAARNTKICIMMVLIALPSFACAQVYGNKELITDPLLIETVENFEQANNAKLALAALSSTDDIPREAELYYNLSNADITIVYDFGSNRIAVAKPKGRDVLSDQKINQILDGRQDEKTLIVDHRDAEIYLLHVIDDMAAGLGSGGISYGICSIIKDGYCNESCYGDLDCECGDGICEYHENYLTCQKDCKKGGDYSCAIMSDSSCDKNCPLTDIDCSFGSFSEKTFAIAKSKRRAATALQFVTGGALLMLIVTLIYILEKNKGFRKAQ